jgi:hypothetical protein
MCAKRSLSDDEILKHLQTIPDDVSEDEEIISSEDEYVPQNVDNSSSSESENDDIQHEVRLQLWQNEANSSAGHNEQGKYLCKNVLVLY